MSDNEKATTAAAWALVQQANMIGAMRREGERRVADYHANPRARRQEMILPYLKSKWVNRQPLRRGEGF